eukprot:6805555-Pyramimonas_sp.AAC.1
MGRTPRRRRSGAAMIGPTSGSPPAGAASEGCPSRPGGGRPANRSTCSGARAAPRTPPTGSWPRQTHA